MVDRKIPSHMANDHDNQPFGERQRHEEPPSTATKSVIVAMREGGRSRIYHAATASNFIVKSTTSNHSAKASMTIIQSANYNDIKSCRPPPRIAFLVGMREGAIQNYHAASSSDLPPSSSKVGHTRKTSNHSANDHDNHPHVILLELPSATTNGCSRCDEGRDTEEIITCQHHRIYHAAASSDLPPLGKWSIVDYTRKTSNHLANNHNNQPLGKKTRKLRKKLFKNF